VLQEKFPERTLDYGSAIQRFGRERGMTSEALAAAAEVSPSYLSEVERGLKRPSTDILAKLARAFWDAPQPATGACRDGDGSPSDGGFVPGAPASPPNTGAHQSRTRFFQEKTGPGASSQNLQRLMALARELNDDDLTVLLDLARHLLKNRK